MSSPACHDDAADEELRGCWPRIPPSALHVTATDGYYCWHPQPNPHLPSDARLSPHEMPSCCTITMAEQFRRPTAKRASLSELVTPRLETTCFVAHQWRGGAEEYVDEEVVTVAADGGVAVAGGVSPLDGARSPARAATSSSVSSSKKAAVWEEPSVPHHNGDGCGSMWCSTTTTPCMQELPKSTTATITTTAANTTTCRCCCCCGASTITMSGASPSTTDDCDDSDAMRRASEDDKGGNDDRYTATTSSAAIATLWSTPLPFDEGDGDLLVWTWHGSG